MPTYPVLVVAVVVPFVLQVLKKYTSFPCGVWTQRVITVAIAGLVALFVESLQGAVDYKVAGENAVTMVAGVEMAYQWIVKQSMKPTKEVNVGGNE